MDVRALNEHEGEDGSQAIYRGKWAGDRFDFVVMKEVGSIIGEDGRLEMATGWKDVTEEIRKEIRDVVIAAGRVRVLVSYRCACAVY